MKKLTLLAPSLLLFAVGTASATPMQFSVDTGTMIVFGTSGGDVLFDPVSAEIDGIQVTADFMANTLMSLDLTAVGPIDLNLFDVYGGFDFISIESLALSGGPGSLQSVGGGEYFFTTPLVVDVVLSATGPAPIGGPIVSQLFQLETAGTGSLFLSNGEITINGITIGQLGPLGDATAPITLKADFVAFAVPEPSTLALVGLSLAGLAAVRGHARS